MSNEAHRDIMFYLNLNPDGLAKVGQYVKQQIIASPAKSGQVKSELSVQLARMIIASSIQENCTRPATEEEIAAMQAEKAQESNIAVPPPGMVVPSK